MSEYMRVILTICAVRSFHEEYRSAPALIMSLFTSSPFRPMTSEHPVIVYE